MNPPLDRLLRARRRVIPANGLAFEVFEAGEGDRLALLLHGFPQHAVSWHNQVTFLAELGYRVWAVNQRGYGGTSRPKQREDYALDQLTGDVAGLIDASEATSVTLIGHDWGAFVAWTFAIRAIRPLAREDAMTRLIFSALLALNIRFYRQALPRPTVAKAKGPRSKTIGS